MAKQEDLSTYMTQRKWLEDNRLQRRKYLIRLARESKRDPDIASKIGGMLMWNQVIEQMLKDIVETSIWYIKARIWPVSVELQIDLDSATFGKVIDYFRQYATLENDREEILSHLKRFNSKRNQVVHDLFDIPDLNKLGRELDGYASLAEELLKLLEQYDSQVCDNFLELEKRVGLKKKVKPIYTVGSGYKVLSVLCKLLPCGLRNRIVGALYG